MRYGTISAGILAVAGLGWLASGADARSLRTVPVETGRSGPGKLFSYKVEVERGMRIDRRAFAKRIQRTLFDERSWSGSGVVAFKQVERGGNTRVILARPDKVDRLCYPLPTNGTYSCSIGERVVINHRRWVRAVDHWTSSRRNYRRMVVNHEVGHRIGHGHRSCGGSGKKAP
jgi:hypothetical protein